MRNARHEPLFAVLASAYLCAGLFACDKTEDGDMRVPEGQSSAPSQPRSTSDDRDAHAGHAEQPPDAAATEALDAGAVPRHPEPTGTLPLPAMPGAPHDAGTATVGAVQGVDAASVADAATLRPDATADAQAPLAVDAGQDAAMKDLAVQITPVEVSGTLCPKGTYLVSVSSDRNAATVTFSKAELQASGPTMLEGSCRLTFDLQVPAGWQFRQVALASTGFASAEQGAASLALTYSLPATGAQQSFSHRLVNSDDSYFFRDVVDSVWSPTCDPSGFGKPLRLVLELQSSATIDAYMGVTALDFDLSQQVGGVMFRSCARP